MGCDIHIYPEYAHRDRAPRYWKGAGKGINPGRDYDLFAKIAGVRSRGEDAALFGAPRGLPSDAGLVAKWDDQLYVSEDGEGEEYCSRAQAESWVKSGLSRWLNDKHDVVSDPDNHSHTWLTPAEFRQVLEAPRPAGWGVDPAYWALLAMLEEFERRDCDARLIIWFDN